MMLLGAIGLLLTSATAAAGALFCPVPPLMMEIGVDSPVLIWQMFGIVWVFWPGAVMVSVTQ
jgi:hypothetical protein